jgi:putative phosphoribosyl transferase
MFRDREDAGRRLAARLREFELHDPIVLGIPRGGVVVADVIALELDAELDIVLARKLRAPWQPELAIGSIAEDGEAHMTSESSLVPGVTPEYVDREKRHQLAEIERRRDLFRSVRPRAAVAGRSAIVVDDGIATGSTMIAALHALRQQDVQELIAAIPVAPPTSVPEIEQHCDRVVCLATPRIFYAVMQFYDRFDEVTDEQVVAILRGAHAPARR